jgi:hypothetical protein
MKHLTQEQIVLHCYGDAEDGSAIEQHLQECPQCREEFNKVKALLAGIPVVEAPEPPSYLEQKVWLRVRDQVHDRKPVALLWMPKWAWGAVMAVLLAAAFLAGRFWQRSVEVQRPSQAAQVNPERILLVAVGDHLERSQMLLVEIMNSNEQGTIDLSGEQAHARDLLDTNRLYRLTAQRSGDPAVAHLLDELERVLAEIADGPSEMTPGELKQIRSRIQSQDLLFKIRVIGSKVNKPGSAPVGSPANQRL